MQECVCMYKLHADLKPNQNTGQHFSKYIPRNIVSRDFKNERVLRESKFAKFYTWFLSLRDSKRTFAN